MQWHSHNTAILVRNKETKHARYENDADNNKKKNKNEKWENQKTQATHIMHMQIIEILKLLIMKNQIVSEQKVIKQ